MLPRSVATVFSFIIFHYLKTSHLEESLIAMTSTTGDHEDVSAITEPSEEEPLLGRVGDAAQKDGTPIYHNLILGTGIVAQAGIWILIALVWSGIFSHPLIRFFSPHPVRTSKLLPKQHLKYIKLTYQNQLLNSTALLLLTQAILILQPTHTAEQKSLGVTFHGAFNNVAILCFLAAFILIEINKFTNHNEHFESPHAIMGFTTYILIALQWLFGVFQYFIPSVFGGYERARSLYKYHRWTGYIIFTLGLATVCAATQTTYNKIVLDIKLWAVIVASVVTLAGLLPRIKKQKLGL